MRGLTSSFLNALMRGQISLPSSPPAIDFIRNSSAGTGLIGPGGAVEEIVSSVFREGVGTSATGLGRPVEMRRSHPALTKPDGIASTGCCIGCFIGCQAAETKWDEPSRMFESGISLNLLILRPQTLNSLK